MSRGSIPFLAPVLLFFVALAIPGVSPWYLGPIAAIETLLTAAPFALAYLLAAWGFGAASLRVTEGARALPLPFGLALMLTLSHLMGVMGLLRTGTLGLIVAWAPIALGMGLFAFHASRSRESVARNPPAKPNYLLLAAAPAIAALLLAACVPPGTLWASEARGFDVLSYHLQLPREWLAAGRIQPLEHNAYSWLPSYLEAAYTHLGAMTSFLAPDPFTQTDGPATIASQVLHALIALAAAGVTASLVGSVVGRASSPPDQRRFASTLSALLFLTTPWVIVTGSLAYNEMAVCLFLAAALLVCETTSLSSIRRGALIGLFVGAACCAKPTALFMVGVPVGVMLLIRTPRREWVRVFSAAAAVGLLMLSPWLARNAIASGNPVLPYFTSVFGDGHWTVLEVARWELGHHESAGLVDRIVTLVSDRGFMHDHFLFLGPIALTAALFAPLVRPLRPPLLPWTIVLVIQIVLWLSIGHLQSRFLIPTLVPIAVVAGVLAAMPSTKHSPKERKWIVAFLWMQSLAAAAHLIVDEAYFLMRPTAGLWIVAGIDTITGETSRDAYDSAPPHEQLDYQDRVLGPIEWINLGLAGPVRRLYLLGDSTPFYYHVPVLYHTTWDPSPLGTLLRATKGDLAAAARQLAAPRPGGHGVSHILVNFSELQRLHSDRWYDPDATVADAEALIERHGRIIKEWQPANNARIVLIELVSAIP